MSLLSDLYGTALASDAQADWQRLWQALAGTRLVVALDDAGADSIHPRLVAIDGVEAVQAFERMETFAALLDTPGDCAEIDGAELAEMLAGHPLALAVTLEDAAEPILVDAAALSWIATTYRAEVDRSEAAGVRLSAPEAPEPALIELLGQTVAALGPDCTEAWLVTLAPQDATEELTLVLGLGARTRAIEAAIAETVTRAVQPAIDYPIAVACTEPNSPLLASARRHGIGIGDDNLNSGSAT